MGRTRWFHSTACQQEFTRRRRDLDRAIDDLIAQRSTVGRTKRQVRDLESEISRLLGVRSAYVTPSEWTTTRLDGTSEQVHNLTEELRDRRVALRYYDEPCPVCDGSGSLRQVQIPMPKTSRGKDKLRALRNEIRRTRAAMERLSYRSHKLAADPVFTDALNLLYREDPYRGTDPEVKNHRG